MKTENKLLTRDEFRNGVFQRDNRKCVVCSKPAQDAHHIIERRLFPDGGYYLDNGASLCGDCHLKAETTEYSVEFIREKAGISNKILPPHLYNDIVYTKWGDVIISNTRRSPGELFNDESVQKILNLGGVLPLYTYYVKYPRTYHCPWSGYMSKDDKVQTNMSLFGKSLVVTEKLDGENTTMYNDYIHARSIDGNSHWTQSWVKQLHSKICYEIPEGWRICGENLYARHSIKYDDLESYFYIFSIWNDRNECLSWKETVEWAQLLEMPTVPLLFEGKWEESPEKLHEKIWKTVDENRHEGYVIRASGMFHYRDFRNSVLKYVRKNHVTTSSHWKFEKIEQNTLRK